MLDPHGVHTAVHVSERQVLTHVREELRDLEVRDVVLETAVYKAFVSEACDEE